MNAHLLLVQALSPIHCGTGQSVSGIDLPIAREKPTNMPLIPGSSLKGVLRAQPGGYDTAGGQRKARKLHLSVFGPETDRAAEHAGAVQFGDVHLVFLPVRSVRGTLAWVTSPYLLRRLNRDLRECGLDWKVPTTAPASENDALVAGSALVAKVGGQERVVFEDFDFQVRRESQLESFAKQLAGKLYADSKEEQTHFVERVCVVHDDVMSVLVQVGMEVTARNRIENDTKTVAKGALWTEESLPIESVLVGLLLATPVLAGDEPGALIDHVRGLCKGALQLGGKATVGRGLCKVEVL